MLSLIDFFFWKYDFARFFLTLSIIFETPLEMIHGHIYRVISGYLSTSPKNRKRKKGTSCYSIFQGFDYLFNDPTVSIRQDIANNTLSLVSQSVNRNIPLLLVGGIEVVVDHLVIHPIQGNRTTNPLLI